MQSVMHSVLVMLAVVVVLVETESSAVAMEAWGY